MCAGNDTGIRDVMRGIVERGCADAPAGLSRRYLGLPERDRPLAFESPPGRVRTRHVIRHAACELRTVREHSCIHVLARHPRATETLRVVTASGVRSIHVQCEGAGARRRGRERAAVGAVEVTLRTPALPHDRAMELGPLLRVDEHVCGTPPAPLVSGRRVRISELATARPSSDRLRPPSRRRPRTWRAQPASLADWSGWAQR